MTTKDDFDLVKEFMDKNELYQKLYGKKDDFLFNTVHMMLFCEFIEFINNQPDQEES